MTKIFLTAEWRKLAIVNYCIDPRILYPVVPYKTELDSFNDKCYVSLVGFMFMNTKVRGIAIPFHRNFPEVNLRFYVRYRSGDEWKRGVVFIKEIVPRRAIAFLANTLYGENYEALPMEHQIIKSESKIEVSYRWKKMQWHSLSISAESTPVVFGRGSEEEFITEHYWGYTALSSSQTSEYEVVHPVWSVYPVRNVSVAVDFGLVYGNTFSFLNVQKPDSVFLAEGSDIAVKTGIRLR